MARTKKTSKGSNLATFIDKVLSGGTDIEKLLKDPVALAALSGVKLSAAEKKQLLNMPLAATLDQIYTGLGGTDKRFLMAKKKKGGTVAVVVPPTMIIPLVGVVVAVAVAAVVIKSVPKTKVVDKSPRAKKKL